MPEDFPLPPGVRTAIRYQLTRDNRHLDPFAPLQVSTKEPHEPEP